MADMTIPAEPNPFAGAQNWRGMDGADAWLVINRNANGWSEVRMMMEAWRDAAAPSPPSGCPNNDEQADDYLDAMDVLFRWSNGNHDPVYRLFQGFVDRVMPLPPPPEALSKMETTTPPPEDKTEDRANG